MIRSISSNVCAADTEQRSRHCLPGVPGGTGERFDWNLIPPGLPCPVVLAGGLTPETGAEAIARVRPWAVDVSSGVEAAKGIKCPQKMAAFFAAVTRGMR